MVKPFRVRQMASDQGVLFDEGLRLLLREYVDGLSEHEKALVHSLDI